MIDIIEKEQTTINQFGCEISIDCKYVSSVEDERRNRIAYVYEIDKKTLYVLNKNFKTLKIEYVPNE
jgi:hypothetical protein